jgi:catechol 2,3-dioxygenase-like lactoylglutathione lyase family enzyme
MATVRYIVDDVDAAIAFYCQHLGFREVMHPAPAFAMLIRDDLRLTLSAPGGGPGGGQAMPDGTLPKPGGWNRISLEVSDIEGVVQRLRGAGVQFRNEIVTGVGGKQILVDDPSGTPSSCSNRSSPKPARQQPETPGRHKTLSDLHQQYPHHS